MMKMTERMHLVQGTNRESRINVDAVLQSDWWNLDTGAIFRAFLTLVISRLASMHRWHFSLVDQ